MPRVDSPIDAKRRGRLGPHDKAGRVIRLMAVLGLLGAILLSAILLSSSTTVRDSPVFVYAFPATLFALVIGLFCVGGAVKRREPWARVIGILFGALCLLGFPLGTIVGLHLLWQLVARWDEFDEETEHEI